MPSGPGRGGSDGDDVQQATDHAVRLLSVRARTRRELDVALERRGYSAVAREAALRRVAELGYLDDAAYAKARAAVLMKEGRFGPEGVVQRLVARGIREAVARQAVREAEPAQSPEGLARSLLEKRGLLDRPLTPKARAKAERLLLSRGFDAELCASLLGEPSLDPTNQQD